MRRCREIVAGNPKLLFLTAAVAIGLYVAVRVSVLSSSQTSLKSAARLISAGRFEEARERISWLLWFDPDNSDALWLTGSSHLKQRQYDLAAACFAGVPGDSRLHQQANIDLVSVFLADYRLEDAEGSLKRHVARYPDDLRAYQQLSQVLQVQFRREEAVDVLVTGIRTPAFDRATTTLQFWLLHELARVEWHAAPPDQSISVLLPAYERHPNQSSVLRALARGYSRTGDCLAAKTFATAAASSAPSATATMLAIAECLLECGDFDAAGRWLSSYENATAEHLRPFEFHWLSARYLERQGRLADATKHIASCLKRRPAQKELHSHLARLLQQTASDPDTVAKHYQRAHELAELELKIWKLTRSLPERPTSEACMQVSDLYEALDLKHQAAAWRQVAIRSGETAIMSNGPLRLR